MNRNIKAALAIVIVEIIASLFSSSTVLYYIVATLGLTAVSLWVDAERGVVFSDYGDGTMSDKDSERTPTANVLHYASKGLVVSAMIHVAYLVLRFVPIVGTFVRVLDNLPFVLAGPIRGGLIYSPLFLWYRLLLKLFW